MDERIHEERLEIGDAFGAALRDYVADGSALYGIERSDGFIDPADVSVYFGPAEPWLPDLARGRVLDIGAGAGRVALALQDAGCDVTALDVSGGAVEVCRDRGVATTFHGTVHDLAAAQPEAYDTFVLMGNNLALLASREEAPQFLDALRSMAAPGARIVGEQLDPYETENPIHLEYHEENRRLGRLGGQVRMRIRYKRLTSRWFDYLFVSRVELDGLLGGTGWRIDDVIARERAPYSAPGQWVAVLTTG